VWGGEPRHSDQATIECIMTCLDSFPFPLILNLQTFKPNPSKSNVLHEGDEKLTDT